MFLKITHGYNIERESPDPLVSLIEKAAEEFYVATVPGAWLVDIFPWCAYNYTCFWSAQQHTDVSSSTALTTMAPRCTIQACRVALARDVHKSDGGTDTICQGTDGLCLFIVHPSRRSIRPDGISGGRKESKGGHASLRTFWRLSVIRWKMRSTPILPLLCTPAVRTR